MNHQTFQMDVFLVMQVCSGKTALLEKIQSSEIVVNLNRELCLRINAGSGITAYLDHGVFFTRIVPLGMRVTLRLVFLFMKDVCLAIFVNLDMDVPLIKVANFRCSQ